MPTPPDNSAADEPGLDFALALPTQLEDLLRARPSVGEGVQAALRTLMAGLGVPGHARLRVVGLAPADPLQRWLRLRVDGRECRYPPALLNEIRWLVEGTPPREDAPPEAVLAWLQRQAEPRDATPAADDALPSFLRHACLGMLALQPQILLGETQLEAYWGRLAALAGASGATLPSDPASVARVRAALRETLARRLSLADTHAVLNVLTATARDPETGAEEIAEQLIAALRPPRVEIHVAAGELRSLTTTGALRGSFGRLRDWLFLHLGVRVPEFRFVPDPELPPHAFSFVINHLPMPPVVGLAPGELMVDLSPEELERNGIPQPGSVVHPVHRQPRGVIPAGQRATLPGDLAAWTPLDYLMLLLASALRSHADAFVDRATVEVELGRLEFEMPRLVAAVRDRYPLSVLTGALRMLVAEDISIRNARGLLERLLDFDTIEVDEQQFIVFDDRLPCPPPADEREAESAANVAAFLRTGMARYISNKYRRSEPSLQVYLVDPELEQALSRRLRREQEPHVWRPGDGGTPPAVAADPDDDAILTAVRQVAGNQEALQDATAILTLTGIRPILRRLIATEIPWLPVLAYQELAPDLNVRSVGRITLQ